jgi:DNA-binding NarL/FixJ family response regulator
LELPAAPTRKREQPDTPFVRESLRNVLAQLPHPAFFLTEEGPEAVNEQARRYLEGAPDRVRELLERVLTEAPELSLRLNQVQIDGEIGIVFRFVSGALDSPLERLELAKEKWKLTARQAQTLLLLAEGCSNQEIAHALKCAVRTAEIHVGALLGKAKAKSRTSLIAAFWQLRSER